MESIQQQPATVRQAQPIDTINQNALQPVKRLPSFGISFGIMNHIVTGEMQPFYIYRYGFYEAHTAWRADPIAISFLFGLRPLEETEAAFPGQ